MKIMKQQAVCILFLLGFCHIVLDLPMQSITYVNDINAYEVQGGCPLNKNDWENASAILNCSKPKDSFKNRYHCMPNRHKTKLLEFCYPRDRVRMSPGFCFVLADNGVITKYDDTNCTNFINNSCVMSYDEANEMYKYPACLKINPSKSCYTSDPECPNIHEDVFDSTRSLEATTINTGISGTSKSTDSSIENQGHPGAEEKNTDLTAVIVVIVLLVVLCVGIAAGIFLYKRNRGCIKKGSASDQIPLLGVPSISHGDVTLDPKGEVKLSAQIAERSPSIKSTIWKKGDEVIDFERYHGKYSTNEEDQYLCLTIHNMDFEDQGQYSCYVTSNTGLMSEPFVFNLDAAEVELDFIPSVPFGEMRCAKLTASFTCNVLDLLWLKCDGNKTETIQINQEKYSGNVFSSGREMNLFINDVNGNDSGDYWVIVKTGNGVSVSRKMKLEILQENREDRLEEWIRKNEKFVCTSAAIKVKESLESNNIVIITGAPGSGKSAIAHHAGLYLKNKKGYKIFPLSHVKDINTFWQSENVCFIIDDPFGKTVFDISKMFHYKSILRRIQSEKHVKLLMSVSWPMYNKIFISEKIASCDKTINLSVEPLSDSEKDEICQKYGVPKTVQQKIGDKENFPLLCSLYEEENFIFQGGDFLSEYEKHVEENLVKNQSNILALIVLCLFNNNILNNESFQNSAILKWVCSHFKIGKEELNESFKSLTSTGTYLKTSYHGDPAYTVTCHIIVDVVLGLVRQMSEIADHWRRVPSFIFGKFLRKLEQLKFASINTFFYINAINLCEVFQSVDDINLLEKIPLSDSMHFNDWYEILISEIIFDIVAEWGNRCGGEIDLSKNTLEYFGYTLLFSIETTKRNPDENKKVLKTKVLRWITKFGSIKLLQNILEIKDDRFLKELDRLLMISCVSNSVEKSELLIQRWKGCRNPDAGDFVKPVAIAFFRKNEQLLSLLKREGAKLDDVKINGRTLLSASILIHDEDNDIRFRKFLAKEADDVDKKEENEETALFIASEKGDLELVRVIIKRKADVNKVGPQNRTPLFVAALKDSYEIVKELVQNQARIDSYDSCGRSSLHEASKKGNLKIVKYLVEKGANVNTPDIHKTTPLHLAVESKHFKVCEYLILHGANINYPDDKCHSPLCVAAKLGLENILRLLIEKGGDVNKVDCDKNTPLHVAIRGGNTKIVKRLLAGDADVNIIDNDFNMPLHLASSEGRTDIVKLLLNRNAKVNEKNRQGQTPLFIACTKGNYEIVKELVTPDALVNLGDTEKQTPLHVASKEGFTKIVKYLIEKGAIRHINAGDDQNRTPLYCACLKGNTDIISHLLKNGANVHLGDRNNVTPLILVSKIGPLENVELIVKNLTDKMQINRCDNVGKSALHYANSAKLEDVVAYLEKNVKEDDLQNAS